MTALLLCYHSIGSCTCEDGISASPFWYFYWLVLLDWYIDDLRMFPLFTLVPTL